ncbi:PspC domain-containing protein [Streptomyces sp. NPDC001985]|uniref:PspC domain-containing protein n=1 Tax=Streptomyces sp. NPDC001985 TaxID=3154406 RepID=UPI00332C304A
MTQPTPPHPAAPDGPSAAAPELSPELPPLRRTPHRKVLGGVCGGLGRYYDMDPVIFRIVAGALGVAGGLGLILYGFAWLLIPVEGEEENEARRLLSGRGEGAALTAVLLALVGSGLFLTMLNNSGVLAFATLLGLAMSGAAVWSRRRRALTPESGPLDPATAQAVSVAPPETKAPPTPGSPSWWRDPIVKEREREGDTGAAPTGYLWGPEDSEEPGGRKRRPGRPDTAGRRGPRPIGGTVFGFALAAFLLGTKLSWDGSPLGTSLQMGLACALGVFGLGLAVSSILGRTGLGTVLMTIVTAGLLAGSAVLPKDISTQWIETEWKPSSVARVEPRYELGSGVATLDLSALSIPAGRTVSTHAEVGAGRLKILIPGDAPVKVRVQAGLGDISLPGEKKNDIDISPDQSRNTELRAPEGAGPSGTLELNVQVGVGQVEVTRAAS